MKLSMSLMMTLLLIAGTLVFGSLAGAQSDETNGGGAEAKAQVTAPTGAPAAGTAQTDSNLEKDKNKDTTATEAQAIVALQCVTGDCYKDAVTDPCYSIGENGCIRPNGKANEGGSSPANANK